MPERVLTLQVRLEEVGKRLDVFLQHRLHRFSRNEIQQRIDEGSVTISSRSSKAARRLQEGDVVQLCYEVPEEEPWTPRPIEVLYEDERVIAVEKAPDLPVHPCGSFAERTVLTQLRKQRPGGLFIPAHRLDRETSGVLLFAKDQEADKSLKRSFFLKKCYKEYRALVTGCPQEEQWVIDLPIGPEGGQIRARWAPRSLESGGFAACTHVAVERRFAQHTRLFLRPETGRQHQLRVHLRAAGHPIVGDKLYGPSEDCYREYARARGMTENLWSLLGISRQALHACTLRFPHPSTGREHEVTSLWPEDLRAHEETLEV